MNYERILSFGDIIELNISCNVNNLFKEINSFKWAQYNPRKTITRYGLSITSLDGKLNGPDLDSIYEYNKDNDTKYDETSFCTTTPVYDMSSEIQRVVDPFINNLCRSHILHLPAGGHFPPHRDLSHYESYQKTFRIIVPLKNCNPKSMYFMYEDKPIIFNHGYAYFINTNKEHSVFSFGNSYFVVMNVKFNEDSARAVINNLKFN